jgi:hypothetical protein
MPAYSSFTVSPATVSGIMKAGMLAKPNTAWKISRNHW